MYNEKTHNPSPFTRAPMRNGESMGSPRAPMRDLPPEDRLDRGQPRFDAMQPRRRCDGTLRDSSENDSRQGCNRGGLDGALRNLIENEPRSGSARGHMDGSPRNSLEQCPISDCARGRCGGWGLEGRPLAMVYSPCQAWRDAYTPEIALGRGTLFAELDLPFEGSKCKRGCLS